MNKQEAIEKIKNIETLNIKDRIADKGVDMVIKNQVLDIVSQIDEPQKPKVPRVAVEFYEKYKADILSLGEWFSDFYSDEAIDDFPRMEELTDWLHGNDNETNKQREIALATLVTLGIDAVEIEQEKLYTVEIPNPNIIGNEHTVIMKNVFNEIVMIRVYGNNWRTDKGYQLTEAEIRKDFEWALIFAEPAEETENERRNSNN